MSTVCEYTFTNAYVHVPSRVHVRTCIHTYVTCTPSSYIPGARLLTRSEFIFFAFVLSASVISGRPLPDAKRPIVVRRSRVICSSLGPASGANCG